MSGPQNFPELQTSLSTRAAQNLRNRNRAPLHEGVITVLILTIVASIWGCVQGFMLALSPHFVQDEKRMVLRDLNYPSLHRTSQSKKIKNAKRKAVAFYNKLMRIAKIECGVGIVKLLLSLTLIVSTIVCFFRTRWAWFLTRWSAFAAAIITLIQYGVFGFSLWTMHQDPIAAEIQFSVPAAAVTGVIVCTIMVAIYFSTWRVLGFSANREIFGA